ncbi:MAG: N-6 DNA methylase [Prevotella sp.]|nr:N-6 DNA methylase [Prevotella sp.]
MLFQKNIVKKYLAALPKEETDKAWGKYCRYFMDKEIQANILQSKEEQFQEGFLRELFVKVLGYTLNPSPDYNLITEKKNETNAKKADGAILLDGNVVGVIELKDHKTTDLSKIETQAFGYKSQHKGTRLVIISNFEKLRLYIDNAVEYCEWNMFQITEEDFRELYLCLAWQQVKKGTALKMKDESVSSEDQITKALYKDYSQFKRLLFADILKLNPVCEGGDEREWQLLLFKKTQKLLDRLLFIFFAEDCGLLPPNSMMQIIDQWETLKELDAYVPFYDRVKLYFNYLDKGHQGKKYEIFAYNGGLFKPDEVLDNIKITDELLAEHCRKISEYDFESDVDVNILGHIFENSLSEIEEVTQQITEGKAPQTSKRKQDGVFYTPQYITKYIVENTVGRLCAEKKQQLNIVEEEYFSDQRRQLKTKQRLLDQLQQYREWLLQITILDPACGSGAFLNAALQFLMKEHKLIDEMEAKVAGSAIVFQDVENSILENNLYGVDINEESVEIAQLALWLRTAKPHRKLNSLNEKIKCGNSLIDPSRSVCSDIITISALHPFDWKQEFPQVFAKGGFDVVISNPPYVQLQGMGNIIGKAYAQCDFEVYNKSADLYCLFYEQGCKLLKDNGMLGFIASNKWLKINYGEPLRRFITTKMNPLILIDFPGVPVFDDATVDPQILIMQKAQYSGKTLARIVKDKTDDLTSITANDMMEVTLSSMPWIIKDPQITTIINKMDAQGKALKDLPISIYRGILTGFNDAYYIDGATRKKLIAEDEKSSEIIFPLYRGRDVTPWITQNQDIYLINVHNGIKDKGIPPVNIDVYPAIKNHLGQYFDKLKKRGDKGNTPYHLRNCAYLEEFAKPKIVYPNMTKYLPFAYDETLALANQKCYIITSNMEGFSLKFLTAILNSCLAKFWIRFVCPELGEDRRELSKVYFEKLHIPEADPRQLVSLADTMLSLNKELQEKRNRFLRRLADNVEGVKITGSLQKFDQMTFGSFVSELRKQKIKLSLLQQDEWEEYFNQNAQVCQDLSRQIASTDKEIDLRVYHLYGLTYDEVCVVDPQTPITRDEYMGEQ